MPNYEDFLFDAVKESLEESGETLTDDAIDNVVAWVQGCYENKSQMMGDPVDSSSVTSEIDQLKRDHKREIDELEKREIIYRQSVATRRKVDISSVYIDGDEVVYDRR